MTIHRQCSEKLFYIRKCVLFWWCAFVVISFGKYRSKKVFLIIIVILQQFEVQMYIFNRVYSFWNCMFFVYRKYNILIVHSEHKWSISYTYTQEIIHLCTDWTLYKENDVIRHYNVRVYTFKCYWLLFGPYLIVASINSGTENRVLILRPLELIRNLIL